MILRAIFWIGLVSVLVPHEPNLGFGRPAAVPQPSAAVAWAKNGIAHSSACEKNAAVCGTASEGIFGMFESVTVRSPAQVKADIAQAEKDRADHRFAKD